MADANPHHGIRDRDARRARIRAGIESVAGKYPLGMSTEDYMTIMRGRHPDNPDIAPEDDHG